MRADMDRVQLETYEAATLIPLHRQSQPADVW
jgi:hypothetical protein